MKDWVIRSKLQPPFQSRNLIVRQGLIERLNQQENTLLTLVHAAPGYGKSTLLTQWRETLAQSNTPVAWLSLDEYDNTVFQFVAYLAEACHAAGFGGGREFPKISQQYSVLSDMELSAAFLTGLERCVGPHVIILDDYHRAQCPEIDQFVSRMMQQIPKSVRLVICSREVPGLPLAALRIREEIVELTQEELRFSETEINGFISPWVDEEGISQWVSELTARTEGWPVALMSVRRWVGEGVSVSQTLQHLSGRTSELADYFLEQVFFSLQDSEQEFLLKTSILERVNGDLGNSLCGRDDGWETLQGLDQKDLFVHSLDQQKTWFRYHRLFSEFLFERLRRTTAISLSDLHGRAAVWFIEKGYPSEAVQHALASENGQLCGSVVEQLGGWHYALQGHVSMVQQVLKRVSAHDLEQFPRLWLAQIYLSARLGGLHAGEHDLSHFEQRFLTPGHQNDELASEAEIMRVLLGMYGDLDLGESTIARLEALSTSIKSGDHVMQACASNFLCAMYRDVGRFDDCMIVGNRAVSGYRALHSLYGEAFIYYHQGYACLHQARLRDAEALFREGLAIAETSFGKRSDLAAIGHAFMSEVSYERNRLHEAQEHLLLALPHVERADAWIDVYLAAYLTRLKMMHATGDEEGFNDTLTRARATASRRQLPRLRQMVEFQRQLLEFSSDNFDTTRELTVESPHRSDLLSAYLYSATLSQLQVARGQMEEAINTLTQAIQTATDAYQTRQLITLKVLLASACWKSGNKTDARDALDFALSAAVFESLQRPFVDHGSVLLEIFNSADMVFGASGSNRLRDAFVAELVAELGASNLPGKSDGLLSPREKQVLRLVIQGHSNREIAVIAKLSINTVKFHLKNIFQKLAVTSRRDAASKGIREQLI